jgi:hypothetical protein
MIDTSDPASQADKAEKPKQLDEVQLWVGWLQQAAATGSDVFQLLRLELRLAIADSKRLLVLLLLIIPMLMLTWLSFSALLAWLIYLLNTSITEGLVALFITQVLGLVSIFLACKHYNKSLSLPLTRQHVRRLVGAQNCDS